MNRGLFYRRFVESLCRDCGNRPDADLTDCPACGSLRVARHRELHDLAITHLDCDAFYAAIEKRDRPELLVHITAPTIALHKPHPGNIVKMYVIEDVSQVLTEEGLV